jgi:hypothetical protein
MVLIVLLSCLSLILAAIPAEVVLEHPPSPINDPECSASSSGGNV